MTIHAARPCALVLNVSRNAIPTYAVGNRYIKNPPCLAGLSLEDQCAKDDGAHSAC
jgi:hypothetical protein